MVSSVLRHRIGQGLDEKEIEKSGRDAIFAGRLTLIGKDDLLLSPDEDALAGAALVGMALEDLGASVPSGAVLDAIGACDDVTPDPAAPDMAAGGASTSVVEAASPQ